MDLYNVILFVHVMAAIFLVGLGFVEPVMMRALSRTPTVAGVREWAGAMARLSKAGPPTAVVLLLAGLYLAWAQWSFSQPWIIVGLVLFLLMGGIAGGVLDPETKKIVAAAEAAPDGPVSPELRAVTMAPRLHMFEVVLFGLDLSAVFVMTNKPGWTGSLLAVAAGQAFALARIAMASRRHSETAVPA